MKVDYDLPIVPETDSGTYHAGVRPRDAAAVIVVRFDPDCPRVLMGTRHARHRFMPGKVVFPGGRIDRADYSLAVGDSITPDTEALLLANMRGRASPRRARAIVLAAIRETFEETGLLIGQPVDGSAVRSRAPAWRAFIDQGVIPEAGALSLIARAITPPGLVRRFDTRFFLVEERSIAATTAPQSDELLSPAWLTFDEARGSDIPVITRAVLDVAEQHISSSVTGPPVPVPFFHVRRGRRVVELLSPEP